MVNAILAGDIERIAKALGGKVDHFSGKRVLLTGSGGFLGYYFVNFLLFANREILSSPCRIICVDNFIRGYPQWLTALSSDANLEIVEQDIVQFKPADNSGYDYIIHAASIASPTFYRKYPIETMDANVVGLRNLLDYSAQSERNGRHPVTSFLFFSSSEIYGDPTPDAIPTGEDYRGFVSCVGPRACYDESKRYGETLCVNFHLVHNVPVKIARPFNNFGPGLSINDRRVIPDFCKNILNGEDIVLYSDGSPTRTFCYVSDAITGYLLLLLSEYNGEAFNIGTELPEISMKDLAQLLINVGGNYVGHHGIKVVIKNNDDVQYLTDNPLRRCPSIGKATSLLGYSPAVSLEEGIARTIQWYISMGQK